MFAKMRTNLGDRLASLRERYEVLHAQALVELEDAEFAQRRLGTGAEQSIELFSEIASKTQEQSRLCDDAIYALFVERVNPLIFRGSVKRAERFADDCEAVLVATATEKLKAQHQASAKFSGSQ
jgi:hypothetical protein